MKKTTGVYNLNKPLVNYNTWHIGGNAKSYYRPSSILDLSNFLKNVCTNEDIFCLGLGSNVLIADSGFSGTVVHFFKTIDQVEVLSQTEEFKQIRVEAGMPCPKFSRFCLKQGVTGAEFFIGIPGTIGGALAMNAGAFGFETWNNILKVETIDLAGNLHIRSKEEYEISYRTVKAKNKEIFVAAYFRFENHKAIEVKDKISKLLQKRKQTQPIGSFNCGSVFRNPDGFAAAKLIEQVKLKGEQIGDAIISPKHANFIINLGTAKAADVLSLIELAKIRVLESSGIKLQPEVKIIGEF